MGAGPRPLRGIHALDDFEAAARRHLPRPIFGYVAGAAETGASNRDNRAAFDELRFLPRVLNNVAGRSQKKMLFGREWNAPFGIAPMGVSALTAHRGDLVLAESAARAGIPMIMSGSSLTRMEDVARAAPESWFQAYLPPTPERIESLVDRVARDAGMDGVILSNHGGRQLDGAVSPLRAIEAARLAVGDLPLMVDSGFRRGSDVLKALALGADFVFVGRPFNYANAIAGAAGVAHAVEILSREIDADLGLLGVNGLAELDQRHLLRPGEPLRWVAS